MYIKCAHIYKVNFRSMKFLSDMIWHTKGGRLRGPPPSPSLRAEILLKNLLLCQKRIFLKRLCECEHPVLKIPCSIVTIVCCRSSSILLFNFTTKPGHALQNIQFPTEIDREIIQNYNSYRIDKQKKTKSRCYCKITFAEN